MCFFHLWVLSWIPSAPIYHAFFPLYPSCFSFAYVFWKFWIGLRKFIPLTIFSPLERITTQKLQTNKIFSQIIYDFCVSSICSWMGNSFWWICCSKLRVRRFMNVENGSTSVTYLLLSYCGCSSQGVSSTACCEGIEVCHQINDERFSCQILCLFEQFDLSIGFMEINFCSSVFTWYTFLWSIDISR